MIRRPPSAPLTLGALLGATGIGAPGGRAEGLSAGIRRAAERHDVGLVDIADAVMGVRGLDANAYRAAEDLTPEERRSLIPSRVVNIDAHRITRIRNGARAVLRAIEEGVAPC